MTNKEWLDYLAHNAPDELAAWFDAEHVETEERALDGGIEPENEDSRDQLEADIEEWASIMDLEDQIDMIHGWLNRRAAILEREMVKFNRRYFDCVEQEKKIAELTAEHDELQEQLRIGWECECRLQAERDKLKEANDYHAAQYELASEDCDRLQAQVDELKAERVNWEANCEDWKKHAMAIENAYNEASRWRDEYRSKFGKCLDYADAIHALMDEGMA